MNARNLFNDLLLKRSEIRVTIVMTTGMRMNHSAELRNDQVILIDCDSGDRFKGLKINVNLDKTLSYVPLERNAVGHRFFSFEGVRHVEISLNEPSTEGIRFISKLTQLFFDVDQGSYTLVNERLNLDFELVSESLCAAWENGIMYVHNDKIQLIERASTFEEFRSIVQKLKTSRIQNFT